MKRTKLIGFLCVLALLAPGGVPAKDKPGKGKPGKGGEATAPQAVPAVAVTPVQVKPAIAKEPWLAAAVRISNTEKQVITTYVNNCNDPVRSGIARKPLPPGLAKKAARGRQLPPAWESQCVPGQVMPEEVYHQCHPLPPEVTVKMPPPPPGTITVTVSGKVVRLAKATLEILDVFDVRL